jgi:uncharacterized protein YggU (UPF0235/DUF167 family)
VDGKANKDLLTLVAGYFRCGNAAVEINRGASGRMKLVRISG